MQFLVICKLKQGQQQSLCNNLGSQLPQQLTPAQIQSQCNNYASNLAPALQNQALSQCNNELQSQFANLIPNQLVPSQAYPQHLKLCALAKHQLEMLTMQVANLKNQLAKNPTSQLQQQLSECQNQIPQYQQLYDNQKSVCVALKLCLLIEGQIQNLNNQVSNLMGPNFQPGNVGVSNLQGPGVFGSNLEGQPEISP